MLIAVSVLIEPQKLKVDVPFQPHN